MLLHRWVVPQPFDNFFFLSLSGEGLPPVLSIGWQIFSLHSCNSYLVVKAVAGHILVVFLQQVVVVATSVTIEEKLSPVLVAGRH